VIGADLGAALDRRAALLDALTAEGTDSYRLFHGIAEGAPGVTIDRYGPVLLVQTFRDPLDSGELERIVEAVAPRLRFEPLVVWNHRGGGLGGARGFERWHTPADLPDEIIAHERGLGFDARPRHRGQDPLWFLDLRAGRRQIAAWCAARESSSVLNLFAYTCGVGLVAAAAGAAPVWNVDFAASALDVGRRNAARLGVDQRLVCGDCFAVARQLAGLPVGGRYGRRPEFAKLAPQHFDLVVLDPPRWAKSPFGVVDLVHDYPGVFKPALLATRDGGRMLVTNNVAEVDREAWLELLHRVAAKAGRRLHDLEVIIPDADFPSFDDRPPLKMAWFRVGVG
jgi:23S rRNA (cytosine1962-C5)-methyltransferase